jgi:hypothetical protein
LLPAGLLEGGLAFITALPYGDWPGRGSEESFGSLKICLIGPEAKFGFLGAGIYPAVMLVSLLPFPALYQTCLSSVLSPPMAPTLFRVAPDHVIRPLPVLSTLFPVCDPSAHSTPATPISLWFLKCARQISTRCSSLDTGCPHLTQISAQCDLITETALNFKEVPFFTLLTFLFIELSLIE